MRVKKTVKFITIFLIMLIIATLIGFFIYVSQYYKADDSIIDTINSNHSIEYHDNYVVLGPSEQTDEALIFYPGGKVEYLAYYPLLEKLSQKGVTCILVKMPFNLAVFNTNAADKIINDFPEIEEWYIGGHSLGGAMASSYASEHKDKIDGVILLGAYIYGDYSKDKTITIYGENDNILDRSKVNYSENVYVIEGGNHGQFGNYGQQKGDGISAITSEEQQDKSVEYIFEFIRGADISIDETLSFSDVEPSSEPIISNSDEIITFPDENFEAVVRELIHKPTGEITRGDVETVNSLEIINRNIADLTGIEYFTALTQLNCNANQLTSLDLSKNEALTHVKFRGNQVSSFNISENTGLTHIDCSFNPIGSLDVSHISGLISLTCDHNILSSLDVAQNIALEELVCHTNDIITLDVSKNKALKILDCSNNHFMKSLDVSQNKELTSLNCSHNNITSLDVKGNSKLESLSCGSNEMNSIDVSGNTKLKYLECGYNFLTTLDVTANTKLTHLNCFANQLTTLDVTANTELIHLNCEDNDMSGPSSVIGVDKNKTDFYFYHR